jgi:hypothetical protein
VHDNVRLPLKLARAAAEADIRSAALAQSVLPNLPKPTP